MLQCVRWVNTFIGALSSRRPRDSPSHVSLRIQRCLNRTLSYRLGAKGQYALLVWPYQLPAIAIAASIAANTFDGRY